MSDPGPILSLIRKHESVGAVKQQKVDSEYDVVWGGISGGHRPGSLTGMTTKAVEDWQHKIRSLGYKSTAAGAYQIISETFKGLLDKFPEEASKKFDKRVQDKFALELLKRRGWYLFLEGEITAEEFANRIAKEWASFPVVTDVVRNGNVIKRGFSYYHQPGFNEASVTPEVVLAAIREAKTFAPRSGTGEVENEQLKLLIESNKELVESVKRLEEKIHALEYWASMFSAAMNERMKNDLSDS